MIDKGFFNNNELDFIRGILYYVNEHVEIDLESSLKLFGIKHTTTGDYLNKLSKKTTTANNQCKVRLSNCKQCSRKVKQEGFCMTHHKLYHSGKVDDKSIIHESHDMSRFDALVENLRKGRKALKMKEITFRYIEGEEYLYDPYTQKVYDMYSYKHIGRMDQFRQLKLYGNADEEV